MSIPFWNAERLGMLGELLDEISEVVQGAPHKAIVGSQGLARRLSDLIRQRSHPHLSSEISSVEAGLTLLGRMGVIDRGKPGPKRANFARFFYPKVPITEDAVIAAREGAGN